MYRITYTARAMTKPEHAPVLIETELSEERPDTDTLGEAMRALKAEYKKLHLWSAHVNIQIDELRAGDDGTAGVAV